MDIASISLPSCSNLSLKAQQFLNKLLCEYFKERSENDNKEIESLQNQNSNLEQENENLKAQLMLLRETNCKLSIKLRAANNMIRILQDNKEKNENGCTTPTMLCFPDLDEVLKKKFNKTFDAESSSIWCNVEDENLKEIVNSKQKKVQKKLWTVEVEEGLKKEVRATFSKNVLKKSKIDNAKKSKALQVIANISAPTKPIISKEPSVRKCSKIPEKENTGDIQPALKQTVKGSSKVKPHLPEITTNQRNGNISKKPTVKRTKMESSGVKKNLSKMNIVEPQFSEIESSTNNKIIKKGERAKPRCGRLSDLDLEPIKEFNDLTFIVDDITDA